MKKFMFAGVSALLVSLGSWSSIASADETIVTTLPPFVPSLVFTPFPPLVFVALGTAEYVGANFSGISATYGAFDVTFSGTNTGTFKGSTGGIAAAPFVGPGQMTDPYLSAGAGGIVDIVFKAAQTTLNFVWGSIDQYNTLKFFKGGSLVDSIDYTELSVPGDGNQGASGTRLIQVTGINSGGDGTFDQIQMVSDNFAFEGALVESVPSPLTGTGLGYLVVALLGLANWRGLSGAFGRGSQSGKVESTVT
ncbi:MAG: hypothetical protein ACKVP4_14385 [Hyphomicrobium sp.]